MHLNPYWKITGKKQILNLIENFKHHVYEPQPNMCKVQ